MRSTEAGSSSAESSPPAGQTLVKKLYYKIGNVCEMTGTQPYILRFWESEFPQLAPQKSRSGQRLYRGRDIETVQRIKQLLYEEGYTIAGARRRLEQEEASRPAAGPPTLEAALPAEVRTPERPQRSRSSEPERTSRPTAREDGARNRLRETTHTLRKLRKDLKVILRRLEAH